MLQRYDLLLDLYTISAHPFYIIIRKLNYTDALSFKPATITLVRTEKAYSIIESLPLLDSYECCTSGFDQKPRARMLLSLRQFRFFI